MKKGGTTMTNFNILRYLGIKVKDIATYNDIAEDDYVFCEIKLIANQKECPYCHIANSKIKDYKIKKSKFKIQRDNVSLELRIPRYFCPNCRRTYMHMIEDIIDHSLPVETINSMIIDFSEMLTFENIARKYSTSITNVINIFDEKCPNLRAEIGEALCIDEFKNTNDEFTKYACILVDFKSHKIIDILPSRRIEFLEEYFKKQPKKLLNKVKFIVTDMYDGYIRIARKFFKNATIIIDAFHYLEYFSKAIQLIRLEMNDQNKEYNDMNRINKNRKLLTEDYSLADKIRWVDDFGVVRTAKDRIIQFCKQYKNLEYAYFLYQDFLFLSKRTSPNEGHELIKEFIEKMDSSGIFQLQDVSRTWAHYYEYIGNSFMKYKGKRLTNGPIEGINSRVKTLKKICCGYRNMKRFFNRIILIVNKKRES